MGSIISAQRAAARARAKKAKSDQIDRKIEEDRKRRMHICNVLVLGTRRSGKSTFLKQFKIDVQGGFTQAELADFRPVVYNYMLELAQALVTYIRKAGLECMDGGNEIHCNRILEYRLDTAPGSPQNPHFSSDIADVIHQLWKDPRILKIMGEHLTKFYVMDNVEYFFDRVLTIGQPNYLPDSADALHVYQRTKALTNVDLPMGQLSICVVEIGNQHTERKKWMHLFESITSIIFCAPLGDYDEELFIDQPYYNRLQESLIIFGSIINSRWFLRTSIILFLNKKDVFKKKLPKFPLERFFPDYTGGDDFTNAARYIALQFMQMNCAPLRVYPHLTQATEMINNGYTTILFTTIKETILQNMFKDHGVL